MSEREKLSSSKLNSSKYQQQLTYDSSFDYTLPRPPVLGEERIHCTTEWISSSSSSAAASQMDKQKYKSSSSPIPKSDEFKSNSRPSSRHELSTITKRDDLSSPACLRWAYSLHNLLQDQEGVNLFLQYLESEGQEHATILHFWFACEGLKKHNQIEKIQRLVKLIYKTYFVKFALPINDELRKEITKNIKTTQCLEPPVTLFDEAQAHIEYLINNTTYPNFLKSDMYLQYLQSVQNPSRGSEDLCSESSSSSGSINNINNNNKELINLASGGYNVGSSNSGIIGNAASGSIGPLPTLHEDMELIMNPSTNFILSPGTGSISTGNHTPNIPPVRLTKDVLLMSQKHRALDIRPKSETYAGLFMYRSTGSHAAYNSYNPVSRQDSEMQSISSHSDARTEPDNLSLADSMFDGKSGRQSRHKTSSELKHARELAALNKETDIDQTFIPRTQRLDVNKCLPMNLEQHAAILREKLEMVKREQVNQELFDKKLKENELNLLIDDNNKLKLLSNQNQSNQNLLQTKELENAVIEKLQLIDQDDNDQDILDEHVSRVFSDLTSPNMMSPRPLSPQRNRCVQSYVKSRRKDKDGFSTFSGDSGNVHDFTEGSEKFSMVKSKSMPEYADDSRFVRGGVYRRSSSKKTLTDLTDSGVSVVSDTPPVLLSGVPAPNKDNRVLTWLMESDKSGNNGGRNYTTHSEMSLKHRSNNSTTSPNPNRHRKGGSAIGGYSSRSNSLERNSVSGLAQPGQPFIADPSIQPPPLPNITNQLDEARRRLEDDIRIKKKYGSNKYYPDQIQSGQSTLRKYAKGQRVPTSSTSNQQQIEEVTTVVFSFCDEQFPYRTKIPGTQVTLRQFKEYLPKKGNYRFFFKTVCEDLDNQVTNEEVSNDSEILPLWEGKIMAQVKQID